MKSHFANQFKLTVINSEMLLISDPFRFGPVVTELSILFDVRKINPRKKQSYERHSTQQRRKLGNMELLSENIFIQINGTYVILELLLKIFLLLKRENIAGRVTTAVSPSQCIVLTKDGILRGLVTVVADYDKSRRD